jgi:hypothetical protein
MSRNELERFCREYLPAHPELKRSIDARGDRDKLATGLALAGRDAGFDFSEAEIHDVFNQELSDTDLDSVAAGATLTCRKAGGTQQEYLAVTMSDVLISS